MDKQYSWTNNPIKILGYYIDNSCEKAKRSTHLMIPYGRILIAKTMLISQLTCRLAITPGIDQNVLDKIQAKLNNFVWANGKQMVKNEILYAPNMLQQSAKIIFAVQNPE